MKSDVYNSPGSLRPEPYSLLFALSDVLVLVMIIGTMFTYSNEAFFFYAVRILGITFMVLYIPCHFLYRVKVPTEIWLYLAFAAWAIATGLVVAVYGDAFVGYAGKVGRIAGFVVPVAGFAVARRGTSGVFLTLIVLACFLAVVSWRGGFYERGLSETTTAAELEETPWNVNFFGMTMVRGILGLMVFWGLVRHPYLRMALVPIAIALTLMVASTGSRKAFLGWVALIVLWLWFCYRRQVLRNLWALLFVATAIVGSYFFASFVLERTRVGTRLETSVEEGGLGAVRTGIYEEAFGIFLKHPITGIGLGNFPQTATEHRGRATHSNYMEILVTTGLVGGLLFFPIYPLLWLRFRRIERATDDPQVRYLIGVFKAYLLLTLAWGIGTEEFLNIYAWLALASIIGYCARLERDLTRAGPRPAPSAPLFARAARPQPEGSA
jgi:O-antigen ligase